MSLEGKGKRVRIYVNQGDRVGHSPAHVAIVEFLRKENASGATVFRAAEGFGGTGQIHTEIVLDLVTLLPVVVEWIDAAERVDRLLPRIKEMVVRGLITVDETEVVLYAPHQVRRVSNRLTAGEVMSRDVASVTRETSVRKVVELMLGRVYRAVPVVEAGVAIGIITNSDLVTRGGLSLRLELLPALDSGELDAELARLASNPKTAANIMTRAPVTVHVSTPLTHVADLMVHDRLKRLPVVDDKQELVGMISRLDLLRTVAEGFAGNDPEPREIGFDGSVPVSRVMRREVPTVYPTTPVAEVMQAVISTRLNRALVIDEDRRVLGLVTDAELLDRITPSLRPSTIRSLMHRLPFGHHKPEDLAAEHHAGARTAKDLMVTGIPIVSEDTPLREAIAPMLQGKQKLIAVIDAGARLAGVVDRADILRGLLERV